MTNQENAVSIKLPIFWAEQPRIWFQQTEAQFALKKITCDQTKYYYVVASLDQHTASRLIDLLEEPPEDGKYATIKQRLLSVFSLSEYERATKLFRINDLGDKKPSQLMDEMLSLMCGHVNCFLFRYIFLQALPEDIRLILAKENFDDPRKLALRADVLWHAKGHELQISKVNKRDVEVPRNYTFRPKKQSGLCFYHERFGEKAIKCQKPCSWQGNLPAGRF